MLIPLVAATVNHGRWQPQGDDALIELRARDVGTGRTPLVGQPSTSGSYGQKAANVAHPGPLGFVVLAPGTRLLGPVTGTLLSTAAVSAACMLSIAWLLYRHLGPRGGAAGAVLAALAAYSAGAGGLVDPLSSNFGRLPLLAAAVGVWALLCGDLRVAPLTVGLWSFAAQQHLSVGPAAALLAATGVAGIALAIWRSPAEERRHALGWVGAAAGVGLVAWLTVIYQQISGNPGNLTALARYSGDPQRQDLGLRSALSQVSTVLGPQPFLGRSSPQGWDLVAHRSTVAVLAVLVVVGVLLVAGAWWQRADRRLVAAVVMVGVLVAAGIATGSNIPDSPEQGRLNFFHWAFALSFFELLVFGWLIARLAPVVLPKLTHGRAVTAVVAAALVLAAVAVTPLVVDREVDQLSQPLETVTVARLLEQLRTSPELAAAGDGPLLVLVNGDDRYIQVGDTVAARLSVDGRHMVFPASSTGFVHPDRIGDPCRVAGALVVSLVLDELPEPPGTRVATVPGTPRLATGALRRLEQAFQGQHVELGADLDAALDELPGRQGTLLGATFTLRLPSEPKRVLLVRSNVALLADHPPAAPKLRHADLVALRDSLPTGADTVAPTAITAHLLTPAELADFRPDLVAGC